MNRELIASFATPLLLVILRVGGAASALVLNIILARTMPAEDMGRALTYMSVALLMAILITASTDAGCVRFVAAYREKDELPKARGILRFTQKVVFFWGGALLIAGIAILAVLSSGKAEGFPLALAITFGVALLMGRLRVGAAHAMAFGKVIRSLAPASFLRQLFLLVGVAVWVFFMGELSVTTVMWLMLAAMAIAVVVQYGLNHRLYATLGTDQSDTTEARTWVKVGLQLGLTLLFVQHSRDLTLAIAAISLPPEDIAVLGIATAIVGFAKFGVVAVNQSITPKLAKFVAADNTDELAKTVFLSNHMKFWPMVLAFAALALLGRWILGIFGPDFQDATPILLILMVEPLALAFFGPGGNYLSFSGRQHLLLPLASVTLVVLAGAITLGAYLGGLVGAAWGTSIAWLFWTISLAVLTRRTSGMDVTMIRSIRELAQGRSRAL